MKHRSARSLATSLLATAAIAAGSASAWAAGPSAAMLANTCAGCHGTNGSSAGPASPTIAGSTKEYFIKAMDEYRNDKRNSTIMNRIAKGYSKEETAAMAGFFAAQPMVRPEQAYDEDLAEFGEELHEDYCEQCHEEGGTIAEDAGILAGQWLPYLALSMEDIRADKRPAPSRMHQRIDMVLEREGEEGLQALIHYYASQSD